MKSFSKYMAVNCKILEDVPEQFAHLYQMTNGEVCEGCGHRGTGECGMKDAIEKGKKRTKGGRTIRNLGEARRFSQTGPNSLRYTMTNAQVASKFGLSSRQVAKLRKDPSRIDKIMNDPAERAKLMEALQ